MVTGAQPSPVPLREVRMSGWMGKEAWGGLHDRGPQRRVGVDHHDDSRRCSVIRSRVEDVFAVERREQHMLRPRSFLGVRALGVSR